MISFILAPLVMYFVLAFGIEFSFFFQAYRPEPDLRPHVPQGAALHRERLAAYQSKCCVSLGTRTRWMHLYAAPGPRIITFVYKTKRSDCDQANRLHLIRDTITPATFKTVCKHGSLYVVPLDVVSNQFFILISVVYCNLYSNHK